MIDIKGFEGQYAITPQGHVWSYPKELSGALKGLGKTKGKWLKRFSDGHGYLRVNLGSNNRNNAVHRLVAEAYIAGDTSLDVNHKDGDKGNPHVSNLEWCTKSENMQHAHDTGLIKSAKKIAEKDYADILKRRAEGQTDEQLAKLYGVGSSTINRVINKYAKQD